jgi:hypothetical protein
MLVLLMLRILLIIHWDGLRCRDIRTKFHDDRFRHLSNITVITATIWEAVMLVLLNEGIYEVRRWDCFMWYDIRTKFHKDWYRRSSNFKFCLRNLRGCNVGITDRKDYFNYAIEMGSGAVTYVPSFIKIGSGIQKSIRGDPQTHTDSKVIL